MNTHVRWAIVALVAAAAVEFGLLGADAAGIRGGHDRQLPPIAERRPATATPRPPVEGGSIQLTADRFNLACDGVDRVTLTVQLKDGRGRNAPDGTLVHAFVGNGQVTPEEALTRHGEVTMSFTVVGENHYDPALQLQSGDIHAELMFRCTSGTPGCPPTTQAPCGPLSPPPCNPSPGSGPASQPCATATPSSPAACNPSPGSGPMSPPCPTPVSFSPPSCASAGSPPCPTPTPTPGPCNPSPGSGTDSPPCDVAQHNIRVWVDCDTQQPGIQSSCSAVAGAPYDVAVLIENAGPQPEDLAAAGFDLHADDRTRLVPRPGPFSGLDANPDFNNAIPGVWDCIPVVPDTGDDGPGASVSRLSCPTNGAASSVATLMPGQTLLFAVVHYDVPPAAAPGDVNLRLANTNAYGGEPGFDELGSCEPEIIVPMSCSSAVVHITGSGRD